MAKEESAIELLNEQDVLHALRNYYMEQYMGAHLSVRYYERRKKEPKNGDDVAKIKTEMSKAQLKKEDSKIMLDIIDKELERAKVEANN